MLRIKPQPRRSLLPTTLLVASAQSLTAAEAAGKSFVVDAGLNEHLSTVLAITLPDKTRATRPRTPPGIHVTVEAQVVGEPPVTLETDGGENSAAQPGTSSTPGKSLIDTDASTASEELINNNSSPHRSLPAHLQEAAGSEPNQVQAPSSPPKDDQETEDPEGVGVGWGVGLLKEEMRTEVEIYFESPKALLEELNLTELIPDGVFKQLDLRDASVKADEHGGYLHLPRSNMGIIIEIRDEGGPPQGVSPCKMRTWGVYPLRFFPKLQDKVQRNSRIVRRLMPVEGVFVHQGIAYVDYDAVVRELGDEGEMADAAIKRLLTIARAQRAGRDVLALSQYIKCDNPGRFRFAYLTLDRVNAKSKLGRPVNNQRLKDFFRCKAQPPLRRPFGHQRWKDFFRLLASLGCTEGDRSWFAFEREKGTLIWAYNENAFFSMHMSTPREEAGTLMVDVRIEHKKIPPALKESDELRRASALRQELACRPELWTEDGYTANRKAFSLRTIEQNLGPWIFETIKYRTAEDPSRQHVPGRAAAEDTCERL